MNIKKVKTGVEFDREIFASNLTDRREELKQLYDEHKHEAVNPYEKFKCCESLAEMADALDVERRTVGKWEAGTALPNIEKAYKLSLLLDCRLEFLLGIKSVTEPTKEVEDYSGAGIIQRISLIKPEIIYYAKYDPYYCLILNEIMDPNNCVELLGLVRHVSALTIFRNCNIDELKDPLKALVIIAFNNYTINHKIGEGTIENYKKELVKVLSEKEVNLTNRQKKKGLYSIYFFKINTTINRKQPTLFSKLCYSLVISMMISAKS